MSGYTAQSETGNALIVIGSAGKEGLTPAQMYERGVGRSIGSSLVRKGLAERALTGNGDVYRLTDAGKAARPMRNPAARQVVPPSRKSLAEIMRQGKPSSKGSSTMETGTPVRVIGHLPNRPQIDAYVGREGVVRDFTSNAVIHGFYAVALNNRDGSGPGKRPILILFHQDELEVLTTETSQSIAA